MPSIDQMLQRGYEEHLAGNLPVAEHNYRSVIRVEPRHPDALHLLGVVQQQRGDAQSAAANIQLAIAENPQSAAYHSNLAVSQMALGDLNGARDSLTHAVRLDPTASDAQHNLAIVLDQLRCRESAETGNDRQSTAAPAELKTRPSADQRGDDAAWADWLAENASLRWDPQMALHDESRRDYTLERYAFARNLCAGRSVLDVGCGTGYGSRMLAEAAASACGIDACAEAVEFATRKYGSDRIRFQQSYAESIPFESGSFEAVTCFEVLEHCLSPRSAFQEIVRVLTGTGVAIVSVPNAWGFTEHHLVDTDLDFLKSITTEFFEETQLYYNNSAGFRADAPVGIGPLEKIDPTAAECLVAVCRKPRQGQVSDDRLTVLLDDAYKLAFKRHAAFRELSAHSYGPLPSNEPTVCRPEVKSGSRVALETESVPGAVKQVIVRIEAEVLGSDRQQLTVQIPALNLDRPTTAQLHIHYADGSVGTCPAMRLVPQNDAA